MQLPTEVKSYVFENLWFCNWIENERNMEDVRCAGLNFFWMRIVMTRRKSVTKYLIITC